MIGAKRESESSPRTVKPGETRRTRVCRAECRTEMRGVFPVWADLSASLRSPVSFADSVYYNTGRKQIVITSQASAGAKI